MLLLFGALSAFLGAFNVVANAQDDGWVQWSAEEGGNGHFYKVVFVDQRITWARANEAALRLHPLSHLATIASPEENAFVADLLRDTWSEIPGGWYHCVWLGGIQTLGADQPDEGWRWTTGEPFDYTNWLSTEPNDAWGDEIYLVALPGDMMPWNDWLPGVPLYHYLVELSYPNDGHTVAIDFKTNNHRNVINPRSRGRVWVAILSDSDFDAQQVDPATIALGRAGATPDRYIVGDRNRDLVADFVLRFQIPEVGLQCGDTEVTLTGETYGGDNVIGTDKVETVGCR
jgi:hypothetical protein